MSGRQPDLRTHISSTLHAVTDQLLSPMAQDTLITRDQAPDGPHWLAAWERHRDNLPIDPSVRGQFSIGALRSRRESWCHERDTFAAADAQRAQHLACIQNAKAEHRTGGSCAALTGGADGGTEARSRCKLCGQAHGAPWRQRPGRPPVASLAAGAQFAVTVRSYSPVIPCAFCHL